MYSIMMTGYMFQNAQYRLELQQGLEQPAALPDVQDTKVIFFLIFFSLSIYEPYSSFCSLRKPFTTLSLLKKNHTVNLRRLWLTMYLLLCISDGTDIRS